MSLSGRHALSAVRNPDAAACLAVIGLDAAADDAASNEEQRDDHEQRKSGPIPEHFPSVHHLKTLAESRGNAMVKLLRRCFGIGRTRPPVLAGSTLTPQGERDQPSSRRGTARNAVLISASLFLTACASTPEPKIITKEVKTEVTVACVKSDLNLDPQFPDSDAAIRATPGSAEMLQLLAAGRLLRVQTMKEWVAALKACQ